MVYVIYFLLHYLQNVRINRVFQKKNIYIKLEWKLDWIRFKTNDKTTKFKKQS